MKLKGKLRPIESSPKPEALRKQGLIPGVIYGHGYKSEPVSVEAKEFNDVYKKVGHSEVFNLSLGRKKIPVLVQDIQEDPVSDAVTHVDFYQIRTDEEIETTAALDFMGEAPVEKKDGTIITHLRELSVKALPQDLPSKIEVDLSGLEDFDDIIRVKDLSLPEKVEVLHGKQETVVSVSRPKTEEELEELEEKPEEAIEEIEGIEEEEEEEVPEEEEKREEEGPEEVVEGEEKSEVRSEE